MNPAATCTCALGPAPLMAEFVPGMFLPEVPMVFPSPVDHGCQVHGTGSFYARVETVAEAMHEGDWMIGAAEWRWSETTPGRRLATRILAATLLSHYEAGVLDEDGFATQVADSYATPSRRRVVPLNQRRTEAKVAKALAAAQQVLCQVHERKHQHNSCPSHCCTVHGCKYGYNCCPVATGEVAPEYPKNNGCEACEFAREENSSKVDI